jgi:hypothetical protein
MVGLVFYHVRGVGVVMHVLKNGDELQLRPKNNENLGKIFRNKIYALITFR